MPEPLKIDEQEKLAEYTYSPNPAVEKAITAVRDRHEPMLPAGLGRFQQFLQNLGNPHLHLPPVFHVAGTNGKGSSLAFIQAILEAAGLTVHKFISPHLVRFEERIVIGGREISDDLLLSLIDECEAAGGAEPVSFFEFFTALAFLAFQRHKADAVLLETGLGGTYDATNVVEKSIALLTRISFDHMRLLGATLPLVPIPFWTLALLLACFPIARAWRRDVLGMFHWADGSIDGSGGLDEAIADFASVQDAREFKDHSMTADGDAPAPSRPSSAPDRGRRAA